jgi:hypothetical protein
LCKGERNEKNKIPNEIKIKSNRIKRLVRSFILTHLYFPLEFQSKEIFSPFFSSTLSPETLIKLIGNRKMQNEKTKTFSIFKLSD